MRLPRSFGVKLIVSLAIAGFSVLAIAVGSSSVAVLAKSGDVASAPLAQSIVKADKSQTIIIRAKLDQAAPALAQASALAREALANDPLAAAAIAAIAAQDLSEGRNAAALSLLEAGWKLSRRDSLLALLLFETRLRSNDQAGAMEVLDILLKRRPNLASEIMPPILATLEQNPRFRQAFLTSVGQSPLWVNSVNQAIIGKASTALIEEISSKLKRDELRTRLLRQHAEQLLSQNKIEEAARVMGLVRQASSVMPLPLSENQDGTFTWFRDGDGSGDVAFPDQTDPNGPANIGFIGSGPSKPLLSRVLALPPGSYKVEYKLLSDKARFFGLRANCHGGPQIMMHSAIAQPLMGPVPENPQTAAFSVPATGCQLVRLSLIASASDTLVSAQARLWIGGLQRTNLRQSAQGATP